MNKFIENLIKEQKNLLKELYSLSSSDDMKYVILTSKINELDVSIRYYSSKVPKEYIGIVEDKVGVKRFEIIKFNKK